MTDNKIAAYTAVMAVVLLSVSAARVNAMKVTWQTGSSTALTLADGVTAFAGIVGGTRRLQERFVGCNHRLARRQPHRHPKRV